MIVNGRLVSVATARATSRLPSWELLSTKMISMSEWVWAITDRKAGRSMRPALKQGITTETSVADMMVPGRFSNFIYSIYSPRTQGQALAPVSGRMARQRRLVRWQRDADAH